MTSSRIAADRIGVSDGLGRLQEPPHDARFANRQVSTFEVVGFAELVDVRGAIPELLCQRLQCAEKRGRVQDPVGSNPIPCQLEERLNDGTGLPPTLTVDHGLQEVGERPEFGRRSRLVRAELRHASEVLVAGVRLQVRALGCFCQRDQDAADDFQLDRLAEAYDCWRPLEVRCRLEFGADMLRCGDESHGPGSEPGSSFVGGTVQPFGLTLGLQIDGRQQCVGECLASFVVRFGSRLDIEQRDESTIAAVAQTACPVPVVGCDQL